MNIICERDDLIAGISTVQRALTAKSTIPVLEGIVLEAKDGTIKLTATDLSISIESVIHADVIEEGKVLLPGKLLSEISRKLPEGPIELEKNDNKVIIRAENTQTTMSVMDIDAYPAIPDIKGQKVFTISQNIIRRLINRTCFAVAIDESRPILTGCLFELNEKEIKIVALDGFRLALANARFNIMVEDSAVVPGRAMSEISKILSDDDSPINICIQDKHILFDLGHTRITSRLLEGEYIKYKNVLPPDFATEFLVNKKMLEESIERASLIARDTKTNYIVMSISENMLDITAKSEIGNAHEKIPIALAGKELDIAFNSKYFTDFLKVIDDEFVKLCFNSNNSPCVVKSTEGDGFLYLILPIRM